MAERPAWTREGADWPLREHSEFVSAAGIRWHVQRLGSGPAVLLLHGTGSGTFSWRGLAPLLAQHCTVVAPDLPGHAFTEPLPPARTTLPGFAAAIAGLLSRLGVVPALIVGHSAGAAIGAQMCIDRLVAPRCWVSLNGALLAFRGLGGALLLPMARLLAAVPVMPRLFAWRVADRGAATRLLHGTGSTIDARGMELYARLVAHPAHVAGALAMMAGWDLRRFERVLPTLPVPALLVAGSGDRIVPASQAQEVAQRLPGARCIVLPRLGHLMHEENPAAVAEIVLEALHGGDEK